MTHLEEGTIVAIRDGQLVDADAKAHVGTCAQCASALDGARRRAELVSSALSLLDAPVDTKRAKQVVRRRLDHQREADTATTRWVVHLRRAAAVVLLTAGAAYALPGSPVRGWLGPEPETVDTPPGTTSAQESARGGIEVLVPDGRIRVSLTQVQPGVTIEVVWTDEARARISAAPGSSFSFGDGRAEADVAGGPVLVELPRLAPVISLVVDGRTYLRRSSGPLEVLEPTVQRTDDRLRFVVSAR